MCSKGRTKCSYVDWVDPEWHVPLKMSLARIWSMYDEENSLRLWQNVVNVEEVLKIKGEKEKVEKDMRFFKADLAKMVAEKEQALTQLGNTQLDLDDLKRELENKSISDKSATNIHQVVRVKAEKVGDRMKQERDKFMEERDLMKLERDKFMLEKDHLKQEKKKLGYMIGDLFKHKEETKGKIRKIQEFVDEIE